MAVTPYLFWLGFAEILFYISGFIVQSAAGHILGPTDYGIFGLIVTLTILIASLIGNGIPIAMSKFLSGSLSKKPHLIHTIKRKAALAQFVLMSIVTAIFFFGAPVIAWTLRDATLVPLLRISAFIIPCFAADAFYFYYYTGIHQFNMQSVLKSFRSFLRVTLIVGLGYFLSLQGFITGYIYVPLSVFILAFIIDKLVYARRFPNKPVGNFSIRKLLSYAAPITGFLVLYQAMVSLNLFAVKAILQDNYLTGLFNGALTIAQIPSYLFYALTIVLLPIISHAVAEKNHRKATEAVNMALRMMTILLVPVIALSIGFAGPLLAFFFGAPFAAGAGALRFLAFGIGLLTLFYVMSFAFQGAGLVKTPLKVAFWGMLLNGLLNIAMIKPLGLIGSGLATCITAFFVLAALFYYLRRDFSAGLKLLTAGKIFFSGLIIFAISLFLPGNHLLFIPFGGFLFLLYFGFLYLLKEFGPADLQLLKDMIPGRKKAD
jgi:PST family polysaccharide transporter